jgi:hypothetical protein
MSAKKAVIVIRHGEKDKKHEVRNSHREEDKKNNLPDNNYYEETLKRPDNGGDIAINYFNLAPIGYTEGRSFAKTVLQLIKDLDLTEINHAYILNPNDNENTYVTSYPLLKELVKNSSFTLDFYDDAAHLNHKLNIDDHSESVLVAGTAETLAEEGGHYNHDGKCDDSNKCDHLNNGKGSIVHHLNKEYGGNGVKIERGKDIYVYSKEDHL